MNVSASNPVERRGFLVSWVFGTLVAYPFAVILLCTGMVVMMMIFGLARGFDQSIFMKTTSESLFLSLLGGGLVGLAVGLVQAYSLHQTHRAFPSGWLSMSTLGGIVGGGFLTMLIWQAGDTPNSIMFWLVVPIFLTILGCFQVLALRHIVNQAIVWAGVMFASGLVVSCCLWFGIQELTYFSIGIERGMLGIIAQGLVSGIALHYLLENHLRNETISTRKASIYKEL